MHGLARLRVRDLNPNLQCALCGGYLINATTIIECLHSFCRPCILRFLETCKFCPICDVQVHKTRPQVNLRRDKTLQDLVYKLVPGLFEAEMAQRRTFYAEHPEEAPLGVDAREVRGDLPDHFLGPVYSTTEQVSVRLEFCQSLPYQEGSGETRYLLCPALFSVRLIKKFIRAKYDLKPNLKAQVFISDESLHDNFTLMDLACICHWSMKEPLKLKFLIYDSSSTSEILPPFTAVSPPLSARSTLSTKPDLTCLTSDSSSSNKQQGAEIKQEKDSEQNKETDSSEVTQPEAVAAMTSHSTAVTSSATEATEVIPEESETLASETDPKLEDNSDDRQNLLDVQIKRESPDETLELESSTFHDSVPAEPGTSRDKRAAEIGLECRIVQSPPTPSGNTRKVEDLSSKALQVYEFSDDIEEKQESSEPPRKNALAFLEEYVNYVHKKHGEEEDESAMGEYDGDDESTQERAATATAEVAPEPEVKPTPMYITELPTASERELNSEEAEHSSGTSPEHQSSGVESTSTPSPSTGSPTQRVRSRKHSRPRKRSDRKRSQVDEDDATHPKIIKTSPSADRFGDYDENEPIKITIKIPSPSTSVKSPPRFKSSSDSTSTKKNVEFKREETIEEEPKTLEQEEKPVEEDVKPEDVVKTTESDVSQESVTEETPQETLELAAEDTSEPAEEADVTPEEKAEEAEPSGSDSLDLSIKDITEQVNEGSAMVIESVNSVLQSDNVPVPPQDQTEQVTPEPLSNMPQEVDGTSDALLPSNVTPMETYTETPPTTCFLPVTSSQFVHTAASSTQYVVTSSSGGFFLTPNNALVASSSASQLPLTSVSSNLAPQLCQPYDASQTGTRPTLPANNQLPQFTGGHLINGNGNIIVNNTQLPISQLASFQAASNLSNPLQNGFILPGNARATLVPTNGLPILNNQGHVIYPSGGATGSFQFVMNTQQNLSSNPVIVNNPNVFYTQNNVGQTFPMHSTNGNATYVDASGNPISLDVVASGGGTGPKRGKGQGGVRKRPAKNNIKPKPIAPSFS